MKIQRPAGLFDREREWADLLRLLGRDRGRLGVVWGARRVGKSYLLTSVCDAADGFYVQGLRQDTTPFLEMLGQEIGHRLRSPAPLRLDGWHAAIDALLDLPDTPIVVLDEFPYLVEASPDLPSIVQSRIDARRGRAALVLCGSAVSQMTSLLASDAPLYRRAAVSLPVGPFNPRAAADFWGLGGRPSDALTVDAVVGGTPGYRDVFGPVGRSVDRWIVDRVLDPTRSTFHEDELVFAADPTLPDANVYRSILAAITTGERTPTGVARATGRKVTSLVRPLDRLVDAGLVTRTPDPLREKRSLLDVSDPFLRFHYAIIRPNRAALMRRRSAEVWAASSETFGSQVLGPRFEALCRSAVLDFNLGLPEVAAAGATIVFEPSSKSSFQVDVVGTDAAGRVVLIGEVKATTAARAVEGEVARLERIRDLLPPASRGRDVHLAVFTIGPADERSRRAVARRDDVTLIDAATLLAH